jgi:hypothetical protein
MLRRALPSSFAVHYPLVAVLLAATLHGLLYLFLIPPWQHYDEPNHFEYAWLFANRPGFPRPGDYDQDMRRQVARSMIAHNFFKDLRFLPDLESDRPIWIGTFSQLDNPPFYYWFISLPLRFLQSADINFQLYAARLASFAFYLAAILAAWGVTAVLTTPKKPLTILVPLTIALLPSFTDLMTAVNSDAGAVALLSLSLWGCVHLLRKGFSPCAFLATALAVTLACLTKEVAFLSLPLFGLTLPFVLLRGRWRPVAWGLLSFGALAILLGAISWGDSLYWHRSTSQAGPSRVQISPAVLGDFAFQVEATAQVTPRWLVPLFQVVPPGEFRGRTVETYTLAGWMWASEPLEVEVKTPLLSDGYRFYHAAITLTEEPVFFTVTAELTGQPIHRLWVTLDPRNPELPQGAVIYYDALLLIEGGPPATEPPQFTDASGAAGAWGGRPFQNLLRNASAEIAGPRFQPWADHFGSRLLPDDTRPSLVLTTLMDWPGTGWFYRFSAETLLRSFWGKFGWGHVPLLGAKPYRLLAAFTLLGLLGAALALARLFWQKKFSLPWDALLFMVFLMAGVWVAALVRGAIYLPLLKLYLPVARYAYPAIIPTMLVLVSGWYELLGLPAKWLRLNPAISFALYCLFFIGLSVYALLSVVRYYYGG